jgi:hypothetical protein
MLKVLTFGSCLARYTSNSFLKLFPGELLGSVFHNRSDAFLANYVDNQWQLPDYNQLVQSLDFKDEEEDTAVQVLSNQYPFAIGLHDLPELHLPLLDRLEQTDFDLIIMDNYMDIRPCLMRPLDKPDERIFFHSKYINNYDQRLDLVRELIPMNQSAENWYRILQWLRQKQPNAFIAFMQFPYNLYKDPVRIRRCQEFEAVFDPTKAIKGVLNIPPMYIAEEFKHGDPQHYKIPQYTFYAGMIYQYLAANRSCPLFKAPSSVRFEEEIALLAETPEVPVPVKKK